MQDILLLNPQQLTEFKDVYVMILRSTTRWNGSLLKETIFVIYLTTLWNVLDSKSIKSMWT